MDGSKAALLVHLVERTFLYSNLKNLDDLIVHFVPVVLMPSN